MSIYFLIIVMKRERVVKNLGFNLKFFREYKIFRTEAHLPLSFLSLTPKGDSLSYL